MTSRSRHRPCGGEMKVGKLGDDKAQESEQCRSITISLSWPMGSRSRRAVLTMISGPVPASNLRDSAQIVVVLSIKHRDAQAQSAAIIAPHRRKAVFRRERTNVCYGRAILIGAPALLD